MEGDSPIETIHIHFDAGFVTGIASRFGRGDPARVDVHDALAERDPVIEQTAIGLVHQLRSPDPSGRLFADAAAQMLAVHLLKTYCSFPLVAPRAEALSPRRLARVRDFVEAHISDPVTLDDMAGTASMSVFHFARSFRHATGETPHAFVRRRRLEHAKRLLAQTDWDVARIGRTVGYTSGSHFAKVFREQTDTSPGEYRRICR